MSSRKFTIHTAEGWFVVLNGNKYLESHRHRKTTFHVIWYLLISQFFSWLYYTPSSSSIKLKSQNIPRNQSITNAEKQHRIRNRNVLKMALATVAGFILCWLPYNLNSILQLLIPEKLPCGFTLYRRFTTVLMASYCIINPCICFTLSRNYRQALNKLLKCFTRQPL